MRAEPVRFRPDFSGLSLPDWRHQFAALGLDHGFHEPLGRLHAASFVDAGDTLVVGFDSAPRLLRQSRGMPLGFALRQRLGWSALSVVSMGDTWFRSSAVARFFDHLHEDDFFGGFDRVLFVGEGPAGYAACTYARACPGALVLALAPQATLDPGIAGWDDRFRALRRIGFGGAYGYAPEGLEDALSAQIVFDPYQRLDAMHAALFRGPQVFHRRLPFFGVSLTQSLRQSGVLIALLRAVAEDRLDDARFARLARARRRNPAYLRRALAHLEATGHPRLAQVFCAAVAQEADKARRLSRD